MPLLDELRRGSLRGPSNKGFDPAAWLRRGAADPNDALVAAVGLIVHQSLDQIRCLLGYVVNKGIAPAAKRQQLIALANRECLLAELMTIEAAEALARNNTIAADELSGIKLTLPTGDFGPGELCQTVIDSASRLLPMCIGTEPVSDATELPSDFATELVQDFRLGAAYVVAEDLWLDVVWNGLRPRQGTPLTFIPADIGAESVRVIGQYRHTMTTAQRATIRSQRLKSVFEAQSLNRQEAPPKVISAVQAAGEWRFEAVEADPAYHADLLATWTMAIPEYYAPLLDSQSPLFPDLTLAKVLRGFLALRPAVAQLAKPAMQGLTVERSEAGAPLCEVHTLAPHVGIQELCDCLGRAIEIDSAQGEKLVRFFTFGVEADRSEHKLPPDLWSAPFIAVAPDRVTPSFFPLLHANLRWLVDLWLKRLGHPLDIRGTEFEVFARRTLEAAAQSSSLRSLTQVCASEFVLHPTGERAEEIDLVVVVGSSVLVAEAKCFLEPVSPVDHYNYREKLQDAADQVQRKLAAVRAHPEEFRARARQLGVALPDEYDILPVVVLNHAIGAGRVVNGVPIVDLRILEMFFEGVMSWMATLTAKGLLEERETQKFYSSPSEAPGAFATYLADPPQVSHLKAALVPRHTAVVMPAAPGEHVVRGQLQVDVAKLKTPSGSVLHG